MPASASREKLQGQLAEFGWGLTFTWDGCALSCQERPNEEPSSRHACLDPEFPFRDTQTPTSVVKSLIFLALRDFHPGGRVLKQLLFPRGSLDGRTGSFQGLYLGRPFYSVYLFCRLECLYSFGLKFHLLERDDCRSRYSGRRGGC